ncbi:DUF397 domain-containing protein [Streptomyces sp. NPDC002814]
MTAPAAYQWFKSSYSGGSGTECVECARIDGGLLVRDSKQDSGPVLTVRGKVWRSFLEALIQPVSERC